MRARRGRAGRRAGNGTPSGEYTAPGPGILVADRVRHREEVGGLRRERWATHAWRLACVCALLLAGSPGCGKKAHVTAPPATSYGTLQVGSDPAGAAIR